MAENPYKGIPYILRLVLERELMESVRVETLLHEKFGAETAQGNAEFYSKQLKLVRESMGR